MKFQLEPLTDALIEEIEPLLRAHYEEIAHFKDIELKPDYAAYKAAFNSGNVRLFTMREDEKLVGYSVFFVRRNLHYSDSLQASQDILFLDKTYRGRLSGYRFIDWCDRELYREGVQVTYHHVKAKHNFGPMLERLGYTLVDHIYARRSE